MRFFARNITAATLAALLAVLASFEHALHDASHAHSTHASCGDAKSVACLGHRCWSDSHASRGNARSGDEPSPGTHDPNHCAVCRYLAQAQLFDPPLEFLFAEALVCENRAEPPLSFARRIVTLVPIRGPPVS